MRLPIRISVSVTPWSRTRSEIALKLVSAKTMVMSVRTRVCIRMSPTTKPCGKISRRIEGSQLDLDQAPGIGQNDDVIEQQRIAAVHESAVAPNGHGGPG